MTADCVVTDVATFPIVTPRRTGSMSSHVIFRVTTASGIVGWGELSDLDCYRAFMPSVESLRKAGEQMLVGYDATNISALHARLGAAMPDYRYCARTYPPFTLQSQLAAALEMACYDIAGKHVGRSVSELLGGAVSRSLPVAYPLFAVHGVSPDHVTAGFAAVDHALGVGVSTFRYYVGDDVDASRAFLQALVDRYGPRIRLKGLDFGGRFHWKAALRFVRSLEGVDVNLIESASWREDYSGMAHLRRLVDADVSEHVSSTTQLLRMIAAEAIDVANVTIQSGGIQPARRLFEMADGAGVRCLLGTTQELSLGTAAGAQLAATLASLAHPCDIVGPLLYTADPAVTAVRFVDGDLLLPEGPGLGIELDDEQLTGLRGDLVDWENAAHGGNYVAR